MSGAIQKEIIRCKDCRHSSVHEPSGDIGCAVFRDSDGSYAMVDADDFCSRGERKSNE